MSQKFKKYLVIFLLCGSVIFILLYNYIESSDRRNYKQYTKAQEQETKEHLKQIEDELEIDLSSTKLAPNYRGVNILNLYSYKLYKYSGEPHTKGEFETTEEYNKIIEKTIIEIESDIGKDKLYAFQIGYIEKVYDIENKSMKIYVRPKEIYPESERRYDYKTLALIEPEINVSSSLSIRKNTNTSSVTIAMNKEKEYYIALFNEGQIKQSESLSSCIFDKLPIVIEMDRDTAKSNKHSIEVLAITRIKVDEVSARGGTAHVNPGVEVGKRVYIFTELIGLWIYNMDTGEIYKKLMISD